MAIVRISDKLEKKIKAIMEKTGWKSFAYALDKICENVDENDFVSYESEVIVKITKKGDG